MKIALCLFSVVSVLLASLVFSFTKDFVADPKDYKPLIYKADQVGDLWLPKGAGPFPTVILVHGGGWDGRDKSDMNRICKKLSQNGIAAFNINYRLAPQHIYPAPIEDFKDSIIFLVKESKNLGLDPNNLAVWGYSAGAQIATLGALEAQSQYKFKAIVDGAGPLDLTLYPDNPLAIQYLGKTIQEDPQLFKEASPLYLINDKTPPMFFYHSPQDLTVHFNQTTDAQKKLNEFSIEYEIHQVPLLGHYLTFFFSQESEELAIRFLKKQFNRIH
jgi:acetyl esterase/lipase